VCHGSSAQLAGDDALSDKSRRINSREQAIEILKMLGYAPYEDSFIAVDNHNLVVQRLVDDPYQRRSLYLMFEHGLLIQIPYGWTNGMVKRTFKGWDSYPAWVQKVSREHAMDLCRRINQDIKHEYAYRALSQFMNPANQNRSADELLDELDDVPVDHSATKPVIRGNEREQA